MASGFRPDTVQVVTNPPSWAVRGPFSLTGLDPFFKEARGRSYLVQVVLFGLQGPSKVGNAVYHGPMPGLGQLGDEGDRPFAQLPG